MSIAYSEIESKRFGRKIYRGNASQLNIEELAKLFKTDDPDVLILRLPAACQHELYKLNSLDREVIFADSLLYYSADLTNIQPNPLKNTSLVFTITTADDTNTIDQLVPEIFSNYTNHYFSNPALDKQKITEGYTEWVKSYVGAKGKVCFLIKNENEIAALATCSFNDEYCEGILYGVRPKYSGKGIYTDLIRYTQSYFKDKQHKLMKVSTQLNNYTVQRSWVREGFNLEEAFITIHLNKK